MDKPKYAGGWATTFDGEHVPVSADEAEALLAACEAADKRRREAMPDSLSALRALQDAKTRLNDEGWKDAIYCPKDGSNFAIIQFGSTGIFPAFYHGEWPSGHLCMGDGNGHPAGYLWKPFAALTADERKLLDECTENERRMMDAHVASLAALADDNE